MSEENSAVEKALYPLDRALCHGETISIQYVACEQNDAELDDATSVPREGPSHPIRIMSTKQLLLPFQSIMGPSVIRDPENKKEQGAGHKDYLLSAP